MTITIWKPVPGLSGQLIKNPNARIWVKRQSSRFPDVRYGFFSWSTEDRTGRPNRWYATESREMHSAAAHGAGCTGFSPMRQDIVQDTSAEATDKIDRYANLVRSIGGAA